MTNMGYVRFRNTLEDLRDCELHLEDDDLNSEEQRARTQLIELCCDIASNYGPED